MGWYHPMGFAWYVDGAHVDADELEPTIAPPNDTGIYNCCTGKCYYSSGPPDCPSPRYRLDGAPITKASASGEDFGLDDYEPRFFYPFADWVDQGTFSVFAPSVSNTANIDPNDNDFFYFCHIHAGMSGRVKILDSKKNVLSPPDVPEIPAEYYQIQSELENFAACFNALDCAMTSGMSNEVGSQDYDVS